MAPPIASALFVVLLALAPACHGSSGPDDGGDHAKFDLGSVPVASVPDPAVLVVNGKGNSIVVVDPQSLKIASTIELTGVTYPHHINLSPDGMHAVVAAPGMDLSGGHHGGHGRAGALLLLHAASGKTLAARRLPAPNHNGVFSPDGSAIWTGQMADAGKVLQLDPHTLETRKEIAVGSMTAEVTISADGRYLFAANAGSDDVSVIDLDQQRVVKTIPVGDNPVGAWPGADNVMYVDNELGRTITAIDVAALTVTRTFKLGFTPGMAALSPAQDELWVTDGKGGRVTFWSLATATKTGELRTDHGAHGVAFSTDGARAFVTNQEANTLSIIDLDALAVIKALPMDGQPNGLVFRSVSR